MRDSILVARAATIGSIPHHPPSAVPSEAKTDAVTSRGRRIQDSPAEDFTAGGLANPSTLVRV